MNNDLPESKTGCRSSCLRNPNLQACCPATTAQSSELDESERRNGVAHLPLWCSIGELDQSATDDHSRQQSHRARFRWRDGTCAKPKDLASTLQPVRHFLPSSRVCLGHERSERTILKPQRNSFFPKLFATSASCNRNHSMSGNALPHPPVLLFPFFSSL